MLTQPTSFVSHLAVGFAMEGACIRMIAVAVALCASGLAALAQDWPARPMTLVVPFAAGGSSDAIARIVAEGLRAELGQPVHVENVGGAGGMLGASRVAKAPPDGYQFVLGNIGTHAQNQAVYRKPLYNAATDFAPVGLVVDQTLLLLTRKDFPADDLQGFITYARANQAKLQYGSAGVGGSNHLACLLLNSAVGIEVAHVPYRSGAQALQDTLAGRIDYQCPSLPIALPQIRAGAVKALASLSKSRSASLPELPSAQEQGLAGFDVAGWYALFLPAATPNEIVRKLNRALRATLGTPYVQQRLEAIGCDLFAPDRSSPEYLRSFVAAEIARWAVVIKASGVGLE
jgi:tripartite-type tricarboxylate transporter receptor subunit TctC